MAVTMAVTRAVLAVLALLVAVGLANAVPPEPPPPLPPVTIADSLNFQKNLPGRIVWAAPGMDAELPCNVTPPQPEDRVNMVLWFKDSEGVPLYSLDNRNGDLEKAEHGAISRPKAGKGRYFFLTSASGVPLPPSGPRAAPHNWEEPEEVTLEPRVARLRILNVSAEDEGVFRCRVDFLNSPTTNFRVKLTLATPPTAPAIFNRNGVEVGAVAGPFQEGYDLQLSCSVTGGHPRPVVTWWMGDTLLDDMVETKAASETVNRLTIAAVTRDHLGAVLQCRAAPLPGAPTQRRDVTLDVYLKPKRVQIMTAVETLPAGRPRQVQCETSGSVPEATVTWLMDGEAMRNAAVTVTDDRHVTVSTVTLVANPEDDGKELSCRAENPRVPGGFVEDRRKMKVAHAPVVTISLASDVSVDQLKEGDEIRLRCEVRANPPPDKVSWYHGNHLLRHDTEAAAGRRLFIVHNLGPTSAGEYSCAAANREGTGRSEPVNISVQFSPRCRDGFANRRMGAIKGQPVEVRCEVLAEPADVRFSWTFNRSKDMVAVPAHKVESNGTVSYLAYTPNGDSEFGTLGCWASNNVGRQSVPCYVHIVAATTPRPPEACSVRNRSSSPGVATEMEVRCIAGADGGLRQHFLLEVYEAVFEADVDPGGDPGGDPYGWDDDKSNEIAGGTSGTGGTGGHLPLGRTRKEHDLGDPGSGSGSGSGSGASSGSTLGQGELRDASASRGQPVLRVTAGSEPFWTLDTHKLEPGRRYEMMLYAVNDKGTSDPPVTLYAVAPPSAEVINGVELRGNMMSRPPLDALASGSGGASVGGHQTAPVAVVLGALIACAALILVAVALAVTLVVCRRRREARREAEEVRRREDFREAVRGSQQVVVGSLKRQPVTPGEEDQFGILVTATSPNSSVVGIREGQQQQSPPPLQQHMGTLGRPHVPVVGAAAAARSLSTPVTAPPMGSPMGHVGYPMGQTMGQPMGHSMGHPVGHPMGYSMGHDDPRRLIRVQEEQMGGGGPPVGPYAAHMGPPLATTIIGSGGSVLNRIRNNNDPDLIISRAEVVLKPLNTSRC